MINTILIFALVIALIGLITSLKQIINNIKNLKK